MNDGRPCSVWTGTGYHSQTEATCYDAGLEEQTLQTLDDGTIVLTRREGLFAVPESGPSTCSNDPAWLYDSFECTRLLVAHLSWREAL